MGRYSSVQAYADNQSNVRTISYDQAKGSTEAKGGAAVRPERVVNPYGSTAGAGSGDFHTYRHARAREMERMKQLEEHDREKQADLLFQAQLKQNQMEAEERTNKRRKKRLKQKEAKRRKQNLEKLGIATGARGETNDNADAQSADEFDDSSPPPANDTVKNEPIASERADVDAKESATGDSGVDKDP